MLHMLLLILKILGIGLLVLLGLLLLFLLIVLFVPLGYEGQGSFIGKVPRGRRARALALGSHLPKRFL